MKPLPCLIIQSRSIQLYYLELSIELPSVDNVTDSSVSLCSKSTWTKRTDDAAKQSYAKNMSKYWSLLHVHTKCDSTALDGGFEDGFTNSCDKGCLQSQLTILHALVNRNQIMHQEPYRTYVCVRSFFNILLSSNNTMFYFCSKEWPEAYIPIL